MQVNTLEVRADSGFYRALLKLLGICIVIGSGVLCTPVLSVLGLCMYGSYGMVKAHLPQRIYAMRHSTRAAHTAHYFCAYLSALMSETCFRHSHTRDLTAAS